METGMGEEEGTALSTRPIMVSLFGRKGVENGNLNICPKMWVYGTNQK